MFIKYLFAKHIRSYFISYKSTKSMGNTNFIINE